MRRAMRWWDVSRLVEVVDGPPAHVGSVGEGVPVLIMCVHCTVYLCEALRVFVAFD